jgi:hypothetical protein
VLCVVVAASILLFVSSPARFGALLAWAGFLGILGGRSNRKTAVPTVTVMSSLGSAVSIEPNPATIARHFLWNTGTDLQIYAEKNKLSLGIGNVVRWLSFYREIYG